MAGEYMLLLALKSSPSPRHTGLNELVGLLSG